jgi:cytochrome c-type biogenesis protein CcmH/NrfF
VKRAARFAFWLKAVQAGTLAIAVCFSLGATDASARFDNLSHRMMCQCGCAQLLGECDHLGCPSRVPEEDELRTGIAAGNSDQQIFDSFVAKYGAVVLAAPTTKGFDLVAWIAPFAVLAAAMLGTFLLVRRWSVSRPVSRTAVDTSTMDPAERERREKIRRETGEGGF